MSKNWGFFNSFRKLFCLLILLAGKRAKRLKITEKNNIFLKWQFLGFIFKLKNNSIFLNNRLKIIKIIQKNHRFLILVDVQVRL